jgi:outer membrane protein, heavy metal efflux system
MASSLCRSSPFATLALSFLACSALPSLAWGSPQVDTAAEAVPQVSVLLRDPARLAVHLVRHNQEVAAAAARASQARADLGTSRLLQNPVLDFSILDMPVGAENPGYSPQGFSNSAIYTVGLSQTIELGKRGPRIASAGLQLDSALASYADTLAQKMSEARVAFGRVVYLHAKQDVFDERLGTARQVIELERTRLAQGYLSGSDFDRLVLDTISLELEVDRNRSEGEAARAACAALLFADCTDAASSEKDLEDTAPLPSPLPDLSSALASRLDVRALELARRAALEDARGARRRAIPDVTVRLGYSEDRLIAAGDQPHTFQVGMTIPIPSFNRGQHDEAKAIARAEEIEHTLHTLLTKAGTDAQALLKRRELLLKSLRTLEETAVPRSATILESSLKAFRAGQISTTDLILARRTHMSLLLGLTDLKFEHFSLRSDLRRVLGLDVEEVRRAGARRP